MLGTLSERDIDPNNVKLVLQYLIEHDAVSDQGIKHELINVDGGLVEEAKKGSEIIAYLIEERYIRQTKNISGQGEVYELRDDVEETDIAPFI